jgi:hypothetical protein
MWKRASDNADGKYPLTSHARILTFTINIWLCQHGAETVLYAVEQVALKKAKFNGAMTRAEAYRMTSAIFCSVTPRRTTRN